MKEPTLIKAPAGPPQTPKDVDVAKPNPIQETTFYQRLVAEREFVAKRLTIVNNLIEMLEKNPTIRTAFENYLRISFGVVPTGDQNAGPK